jgi:hypothetical protein
MDGVAEVAAVVLDEDVAGGLEQGCLLGREAAEVVEDVVEGLGGVGLPDVDGAAEVGFGEESEADGDEAFEQGVVGCEAGGDAAVAEHGRGSPSS